MDVREIIKKYLVDNEYDGLVNEDGECGCQVGDLFPCGDPSPFCEAGHKLILEPPGHPDYFVIKPGLATKP